MRLPCVMPTLRHVGCNVFEHPASTTGERSSNGMLINYHTQAAKYVTWNPLYFVEVHLNIIY